MASPLITMDEAMAQLRYVPDDPSADQNEIQRFIDSAISVSQRYLQRYVYVDQATLDAAVAAVPAAVQSAEDAYTAALAAVAQMPLGLPRDMALYKAETDHDEAASSARQTYRGMVINESIKRGMLMLISHYDQNREAVHADLGTVAELPLGVDAHLFPFRVQLGV